MAKFKRKQADSLWLDITISNLADIDAVWANWTGKFTIAQNAGGTAIVTGNLVRAVTSGVFQLRLGPVSGGVPWSGLPVGQYVLTIELNNVTADFKDEEQHQLVVTAQGA